MYSIKIKADRKRIFRELGRFGDEDREYFRPRLLKVYRTAGKANEAGSVIQYHFICRLFDFSIELEQVIGDRYLVYRVRDGFARGGVLVFHITTVRQGVSLLSIYVGFGFPKGENVAKRWGWYLFKILFPGFVHDVLWNHSLCKLKNLVELQDP